ncbi:hypothetical protein A5886_002089 [Enterococcus sp. 8G7_MSG3316]|uniref:acylphosphatase n=1 Tax=Candidatus Enterococcus testudinis TaxID=1834191 RepID=A0A242A7W0_9ENTE|nr:acylphosphatase [Enterococcus sp. 8G7_MSG3316]OTN77009.1 hypothetical protein A5886_002089 [Enterococcus sp. 8G7_MSG3316]
MKKVRITVNGRVQGVGFRYTTKMLADQLGITGTVKNESDGTVTIEAIGEPQVMAQFIEGVKGSPSPVGKVNDTTINEDPSIETRDTFDVVYS